MTKIKLNNIDIKHILSKNFNRNDYLISKRNNQQDFQYGLKVICIAHYIIGYLKSQIKNNKHYAIHLKNKIIHLNSKQIHLTYEQIAKICNCSFELIRLVIRKLEQLKVLKHIKIDNTNQWYFIALNLIEPVIKYFLSCKQVYSTYKSIININDDFDETVLEQELKILDVEW